MDDVQPKLLSVFLQEAQEKLPAVESFLLARDSEGCDLLSLDAAFRATHAFKGTAGLIKADSIRAIALRIEKILEKHLLAKTCPTQVEYDALILAQKQISVLVDCLKNKQPEPTKVATGAIQSLDLAGAFPGKPSQISERSALIDDSDPFAEDSSFDRLDVDYDERAIVGSDDSGMPDDIFADDQKFELSGSSRTAGSKKLESTPYIDPFAEDPGF